MAGNEPGARPRSPHLQVYKWTPAMAVSIFHRISGDGLAIVGACLFLWWLGALAAGPDAYAAFIACVWHDPDAGAFHRVTNILGKIVLIGLTWLSSSISSRGFVTSCSMRARGMSSRRTGSGRRSFSWAR